MLNEIKSKKELEKLKKENKDLLIITFYTEGSQKSKKALDALKTVLDENPDAPIFTVNASKIKDIHPDYGISMAPSSIVLKEGKVKNIVYGAQDKQYYEMLLFDIHVPMPEEGGGEAGHDVVVYTSPTCSWCNALKNYLKKNNVYFTEIDISRDQQAGQELVRRSGQMGVPQTDIDGEIVVGFDKPKLDAFLGINGKK